MPVEFPTVQYAEKVSYVASIIITPGSTASSIIAPLITITRPMITREVALRAIAWGIFLLNIVTSSCPEAILATETSSTVTVDILTPPAVEPDAPPINIIAIEMTLDESVSNALSKTENPAVLSDTV